MQKFEGSGATLEVYPTKIVIKRHGLLSFLTQGSKGDKEIFIKNITAIQLKEPGFTKGFIQFSLSGESASKGGAFDAVKDENSIMIGTMPVYKTFVAAKNLIESHIQGQNKPQVQQPVSIADELSKLVELKKEGFLTEEEFQEQKRKLLL